MKKTTLFIMLFAAALLFSGCEVVLVAPGIQPGTPVTIDDEDGVTETINPRAAGRFELNVGAEPVRIDVFQETYTLDGDLTVTVADEGNHVKALTASRNYFVDPNKANDFASSLGIGVGNPPYSINIPANFGKAYVMVRNETDAAVTVTVKAFKRNVVERNETTMTSPDTQNGETSKSYGGAILFLKQKDSYIFQGQTGDNLTFTVPGTDYLKLKLKIVGTTTELSPGESAIVANGDKIEVYAEDDARAGFCKTFDGCQDGINSGEYKIEISR